MGKDVVPPRRLPVECKKDYQNPTTTNHFMPAQSAITPQGEDNDGMPGTRLPIVQQIRVPTVPKLPSPRSPPTDHLMPAQSGITPQGEDNDGMPGTRLPIVQKIRV